MNDNREVNYIIYYKYPESRDWPHGNRINDFADDSGNFSRHHIIPYYYLYAFGVVCLSYLCILDNDNHNEYENMKKIISRNFLISNMPTHMGNITGNATYLGDDNRKKSKVIKFDDNACCILNSLAWIPANLFVGPAGKFRCDDPGQADDFVPEGLTLNNNSLIFKLNSKKNIFISKTQLALSAGTSATISIDREGIFDIGKLYCAENFCLKKPYITKVSDWAVCREVRSGVKKYYSFYFEPDKFRMKGIEEFKLCILSSKSSAFNYKSGRNTRNKSIYKSNLEQNAVVKIVGLIKRGDDCYFKGVIETGKSLLFNEQQDCSIVELVRKMG